MFLKQVAGQGQRTKDIIQKYFFPEFITALILYFLPLFIDAYFIGYLQSSTLYTISAVVDNSLNMFVKIAEGLSLGIVVLGGQYNGKREHKNTGKIFVHGLWTVLFFACCVCIGLYLFAQHVLLFYNLPEAMVQIGVPFLRVRIFGLFLLFLSFSLIGFLRSIKNAVLPMVMFGAGALIFVICDYFFIFGWGSLQPMGLLGSAWAYVAQYAAMTVIGCVYILFFAQKEYAIGLYKNIPTVQDVQKLLFVSLPIVVDKSIMAWAYVWLAAQIGQLGAVPLGSFGVIKLMERLAFVPATAFSQVSTFLASNDAGRDDWAAVRANTIKIFILAAACVCTLLYIGSAWPEIIVSMIDRTKTFGPLTKQVFPLLSFLVLFDLLQLILSGTLRGVGAVYTVMLTRTVVIVFFFMPISYVLAHWIQLDNQSYQFVLIYGSFFIGNLFMSILYVARLWLKNR
ncbi:MATE family efflux transporter [bacterium]|nr:MATE family efflux transporter [bacterium]